MKDDNIVDLGEQRKKHEAAMDERYMDGFIKGACTVRELVLARIDIYEHGKSNYKEMTVDGMRQIIDDFLVDIGCNENAVENSPHVTGASRS